MIKLLRVSVDAMNTMSEAHDKQAEVIQKTLSVNQDIAENIKNENERFVSSNAMVDEMSQLLKIEQ